MLVFLLKGVHCWKPFESRGGLLSDYRFRVEVLSSPK